MYIDDYSGMREFGDSEYEGYIKCKLLHNIGYSVVFPDQIYFDAGGSLYWLQPFFFSGNLIANFDEGGLCDLGVDISHGQRLRIRFTCSDAVSWLNDGSIIY